MLRLMMGDTAARRAAAKAERWRNMVGSIEGCRWDGTIPRGFDLKAELSCKH